MGRPAITVDQNGQKSSTVVLKRNSTKSS